MDKSLLKRALEDTEDPTPGYMFRDIAQWTFIDHNTQAKLIAYLMDKLKPTASVHVLAKTLRVIKILCETGHADFQKEIQRLNDDIKQFASYRGKPDAKFGDKLNEKVRTCARETIEAAFTHRKENKVQVSQGHGSDTTFEERKNTFNTGTSVSDASWSGSSNPSTNAHMAPMPTTNKWAEHMAAAAAGKNTNPSHVGTVVNSLVSSAKTGFGFWQENIKSTEERVMESFTHGTDFRPVELGFGVPTSGGSGPATAGGWKFTDDSGASAAGASALPKEETKILTPFQVEVEKICSFKNAPQRVDLTQFVQAVETISSSRGGDLEELAEALDERLQQKYSWQQRLNAMCAIEAVLRSQPPVAGHDSFEQYFKENPEDVQRNIHVVQASLKEKSQKVLKILAIPERTKASVETSAAQQIHVATSNGGMMWASVAPQEAPAPSSDCGDLLGGMTVKSRASGKPVEDKTKLRKRAALVAPDDETPPPAPPAQQNTSAGGGDAWGSWGSGDQGFDSNWGGAATSAPQVADSSSSWSATAAAAPQPSVAPPPPKPRDALDDFFGSSNVVPPIVAQPVAPATFASQPAGPLPVAQPAGPQAAAPTNSLQMSMVLQMQQQLQLLMSQINMSDPNAMTQIQSLMQQQQQLMAMIAAMPPQPQQPLSAPPSQPAPATEGIAVVPHDHFQVNMPTAKPSQAAPVNDSFARVQQEMMTKLMTKQ